MTIRLGIPSNKSVFLIFTRRQVYFLTMPDITAIHPFRLPTVTGYDICYGRKTGETEWNDRYIFTRTSLILYLQAPLPGLFRSEAETNQTPVNKGGSRHEFRKQLIQCPQEERVITG